MKKKKEKGQQKILVFLFYIKKIKKIKKCVDFYKKQQYNRKSFVLKNKRNEKSTLKSKQ